MVDAAMHQEQMLEGAFEFIGLLSPEGLLLEVNRAALDFVRVSPAEVIGRPIWTEPWIESPEQALEVQEAFRVAARGSFVRRVLRRHSPLGRNEAIDFSLSPLHDEHGAVGFVVAEGRLVTGLLGLSGGHVVSSDSEPDAHVAARMRGLVHASHAREAAVDHAEPDRPTGHSERAYRAAFEAGLAKAEVEMASGRVLAASLRLASLLESSVDDLTVSSIEQAFAKESWPQVQRACADLLREPRTPRIARVRARTARGRELPVEVVLSAVETGDGLPASACVMSFQDVSRLALAEARRHSAETLSATLVESAVDGIIVADADGAIELFNPAATTIFGYHQDEIVGQTLEVLVPGWRRSGRAAAGLSSLTSPEPAAAKETGCEAEGRRKDGSVVPLFVSISQMQVGNAPKFTCIAHDLTALRQAEREVRRVRERFELAARGAVDVLWEWTTDPPGTFYLSDRFGELLGYAGSESPQTLDAFTELVHPDDRDLARQATHDRLPIRAAFATELRLRCKSGDYRWFRWHGQAVWGEDDLPARMAGSLTDISDERTAKAELAARQVLAELGKMAAVVVHEVRNPIAGVQGALDVLISRRLEDDEERDIMIKMRRRLDHLSELVGDLLVYSQPKPLTLQPTRLRDVLESLVSLVRTTPVCAGVTIALSPTDLVLSVDGGALGRALLNLVLNAAQALRGQGHIEITAVVSSGTLEIGVADTGPGMPAQVRSRLFEPFFTTKKGGTGLGLAIAKRIAEQHGGVLQVDSAPGQGTRVTMRLPLTVASTRTAADAPVAEPAEPVRRTAGRSRRSHEVPSTQMMGNSRPSAK